ATRRTYLDHIGAVLDDLPRLVLHTFNSIGSTVAARVIFEGQQIVVAVPAGNAQCRPADNHARTRYIPGVDRIPQGNIGVPARTYIPDRRDPGLQRDPRIVRSH